MLQGLSTKPLSPLDVLGDGSGYGGDGGDGDDGDELLSVDHDPLSEGAVGKTMLGSIVQLYSQGGNKSVYTSTVWHLLHLQHTLFAWSGLL